MFHLIFQKVWSKKWMMISLLLANLLIVAIASAGPMYSDAALQRTLVQNLNNEYTNTGNHSGIVSLPNCDYYPKSEYFRKMEESQLLFNTMLEDLELPVQQNVVQYIKSSMRITTVKQVDGETNRMIGMRAYSDMEEHIRIVKGELYGSQVEDNVIEVIVNERTFMKQRFVLGGEYRFSNLKNADGEYYRLRITGVFEAKDPYDTYWSSSPASLQDQLFVNVSVFQQVLLSQDVFVSGVTVGHYAVVDYTAMDRARVTDYLRTVQTYREQLRELSQNELITKFEKTLTEFIPEAQKANTTIWVLLLPIFILLVAFIFMVSGQILEIEQNEIAIYKSRGANKRQIIIVYLLQSLLIAVLSLVTGIPLGLFMCQMLGATNSFLEFVKRVALPLAVEPQVLLFALGAAIISCCTMVLPVLKYANVNIVAHKRQKNNANKAPLWQRMFLDVAVLAVSVYGLYQFNGQKEFLAQQVLEGASMNPLLYLCSSLFMFGCGLLVLRVFPWIVRIVFRVGEKWWSPSLYASFLRIIRTKSSQGFLIVFLVLTVGVGIYNAQAARTINANTEEKIRYITGTDLVLQEVWSSNTVATVDENGKSDTQVVYGEPDFGKYLTMDGVKSVTRVLVNDQITVSVTGGKVENVKLMGIHTKEFGQTAWFKQKLLPLHYHAYLNAIAQNPQTVLVSSNLQEKFGYKLGDSIKYTNAQGQTMHSIIAGFVDYWPGYAPVSMSKGKDGIYKETEQYLIVANLSQVQSNWGVTPYQVWIKTTGSSRFIYDYAEETGMEYELFEDASAKLIAAKNDPVLQGTNGVLTIGFICVLILCSMGFLIFWIMSIRSRTLQFGVFRAMGMSMGEIITMLANEQIFITGISIGAGILVGTLTSKLFIPLIQIAYSSADQVLPMEIISWGSDYVRLFGVIGTVIMICMFVLAWLISKIKISQALKLGED